MKSRLLRLTLSASLALAVTGEVARAETEKETSREIEIIVEGAYKPNTITMTQGEQVRLKFVRRDYGACTREVVFSDLKIRKELPTNKPVIIDLPRLEPGRYEFKCGMNMIKGTLVVKPVG